MCLLILRAGVNLRISVRLGHSKACGVLAVGNLVQLGNPRFRHAIMLHVCPALVDSLAVNADYRRYIMHALHAAFNLQAAHTGAHQLRQIFNQAQVLGVHHIGTVLVLFEVKVFARALLLTQLIHIIFPTAGLSAGTAVAVAPGQIGAQKAASAVGNAHRAMHEGFQLYRGFFADFADFSQGQLACQHHAFSAQLLPRLYRGIVGGISLRAHVQRHIRHNLAGSAPYAQIADQQCVNLSLLQSAQIIRQSVDILVMRKNIYRYINLFAEAVCILCHLRDFL